MLWRDRRLLQRLALKTPLIQAPMAGAQASELAIAVARGGGLGSIPCALLKPDAIRQHVGYFRKATKDLSAPLNLNFFCHTLPSPNLEADAAWQKMLEPYYRELGLDTSHLRDTGAQRMPFDDSSLELVRELRPEVVSFHFGLPRHEWVQGVKAMGALMLSSATSVREARWLEERGCDAVIAQGSEAGGHRAVFLPREDVGALANADGGTDYRNSSMDFPEQVSTMALVPQIVDAINLPVIASGGIGDARGALAANALGAAAVQMGTVFLLADETNTSKMHREMLKRAAKAEEGLETAITNVFSGRPARGFVTRVMRELGPMCPQAPEFPGAGAPLAALRKAAQAVGDPAFTSLWSGQSPGFARETSAENIVRSIATAIEQQSAL